MNYKNINYKFKYLFENDTQYIAEIVRLDLPLTASKKELCHWIIFNKVTVNLMTLNPLNFISSDCNIRCFKEGQLYINDKNNQVKFIPIKTMNEINYDATTLNDLGSHTVSIMLTNINSYFRKISH